MPGDRSDSSRRSDSEQRKELSSRRDGMASRRDGMKSRRDGMAPRRDAKLKTRPAASSALVTPCQSLRAPLARTPAAQEDDAADVLVEGEGDPHAYQSEAEGDADDIAQPDGDGPVEDDGDGSAGGSGDGGALDAQLGTAQTAEDQGIVANEVVKLRIILGIRPPRTEDLGLFMNTDKWTCGVKNH